MLSMKYSQIATLKQVNLKEMVILILENWKVMPVTLKVNVIDQRIQTMTMWMFCQSTVLVLVAVNLAVWAVVVAEARVKTTV